MGVALAANGAVTFYNGAKTLILAVCQYEDPPPAENAPQAGQTAPAPAPKQTPPASAAKPAPKEALVQTAKPVAQTPQVTKTVTRDKPPPGANPRNAHLAGTVHPKTKVPFDKDGYPDFRAAGVVKKEVKIKFTGDRKEDIKRANEKVGWDKHPADHVLHHHQDGETMQLIPRTIHEQTGHTGGFAATRP